MPNPDNHFDCILVGGGLQNGLIALALRHHHPHARIALVEAAPALAGNHTWCFHDTDVDAAIWQWLQPAVAHRWPGYRVAFNGLDRRVSLGYAAIPSFHFAEVTAQALAAGPGKLWLTTRAVSISQQSVVLDSGETLTAPLVVDARGQDLRSAATGTGQGWQKFVGLELQTAAPHGLGEPILMDARVEQRDGMRFVYVLPLDAHRLLVEDTCFSDHPHLDEADYRARVLDYANRQGWFVNKEIRKEQGVLPMPWQTAPSPSGPALVAGTRGGWFHPLTGYSLPEAARLAQWLAKRPLGPVSAREVAVLQEDLDKRSRLARWLAFALFRLSPPQRRAAMLERFYRRPDAVIARFYALQSTFGDVWRITAGAPPRGMHWWPRRATLEVLP